MINFNALKLVLFDFDDTLAIHSDHKSGTSERFHKYNVNIYKGDMMAFSDCKPNRAIGEFINKCKYYNIKMGLISAVHACKHADLKLIWIKNKYDVKMENYCVCSAEDKVTQALAITEALGLQPSQVLIVDDRFDVLESFGDCGFQHALPMEIVNYITD